MDQLSRLFNRTKQKTKRHAEAIVQACGLFLLFVLVPAALIISPIISLLDRSFWGAVKKGDTARVKKFLKKNPARVNELKEFSEDTSYTPLFYAVEMDDHALAELLLKNGADVNFHAPQFCCPTLSLAVHKKDARMAEILLKHGAVQHTDTQALGPTPLMTAVINEDTDMVKLLLQHDASGINTTMDENYDFHGKGDTALSAAIERMNVGLAQLLLDHGAKQDACLGDTPLIEAAWREDSLDMVKLLVKNDPATVNGLYHHEYDREITVKTALKSAISYGRADVVAFLLENGARQDLDYEGGRTPLVEAVLNRNIGIVEMLLKHDAGTINRIVHDKGDALGLSSRGPSDETALTYAVKYASADIINLLLEYGARQDLETTHTPLEIAEKKDRKEIIENFNARAARESAEAERQLQEELSVFTKGVAQPIAVKPSPFLRPRRP